LTKQYTAAGIMLLAQEGKLALSDPITRHLPNSPSHWQAITIEHLLTHASGIRDYTKMPGFLENMAKEKSVDELIAVFRDEPLQFAPGSRFAYSNSGYVLLGAVISRASGLPYDEFMARSVFIPLGLNATAVKGHERGVWAARSARVQGYRRGDPAPPVSASQSYAAGSLVSDVDDLARWDAAISDGRLLKPENWRMVFSPHRLSDGEPTTYGYGWFLSSRAGHPTAEHFGATSGFSCAVLRMPQDGVYIAFLTNNDLGNVRSAVGAMIRRDDPSTLTAKLAEAALAND
jgi:D-alanyl-D-alanine carboxypeptidase